MIGHQVGNYTIEAELGAGGMGAVYRAVHTTLRRPAAIKVLLPQFSADPITVQRFFNEARAATSIRHLGIVEIYDFGQMADGAAYIAMELLRGESMGARIARTSVALPAALGLTRQICGALGAAHERSIVHRDLKPDNIFIIPDPEVPGGERIKLLDFGIAKLAADKPGDATATRTGALMGTPTYMAPEQCRGVKVDHRADLYALGCILYQLLAGRPPFVGEGLGDVLGAHIYEAPPPIESFAPHVTPEVSRLVAWMMAKPPDARPQSTQAIIAAIDEIVAGRGQPDVTGPPPQPATPATTTLGNVAGSRATRPSAHGHRRSALAVAGAIAVMGGVVAVALSSGGDQAATAPDASTAASVAIDAAPIAAPPIDAGLPDAISLDVPPAIERVRPGERRPRVRPPVNTPTPTPPTREPEPVGEDDAINPYKQPSP